VTTPSAQGGRFADALQAAARGGHEPIVRLLVDKGADINAQGGDYGNAFQATEDNRHLSTARFLVKSGACR
jgi:ankyrin repeat protein